MNAEKDHNTYRETVFITLHGCGPVYHLLEQNYISEAGKLNILHTFEGTYMLLLMFKVFMHIQVIRGVF
jgi:hypothetical protein